MDEPSEGNPFIAGTDLYLAYEAGFAAAVAQRRREDEEDETYPARAARALEIMRRS